MSLIYSTKRMSYIRYCTTENNEIYLIPTICFQKDRYSKYPRLNISIYWLNRVLDISYRYKTKE